MPSNQRSRGQARSVSNSSPSGCAAKTELSTGGGFAAKEGRVSLIDRGDVFFADLEIGPHPVVVISRQEAITHRTNVSVVLVTSTIRGHVR